tara:strand:+ start:803 stop:1039 length:237 start_codon:yes stop_codon:yes gene_type:complete
MKKPNFDDDVSMPVHHKGPKPTKYVWLAEMEIGQSFVTDLKTARQICSVCYKNPKYLPAGFKVRIQTKGNETRVWRIA